MTKTHQQGRLLFLVALGFIAIFVIKAIAQNLAKGTADFPSGLLGNGLLLLMLVLAFRGGQISLKFAKGLALLLVGMFAILLVFVTIYWFRGGPLPVVPTVGNTIPVIGTAIGAGFTTWALFLSRDVKAFVSYQREQAYQRQLAKVRRPVAI